jgi:hypothetical protein
MKKKFSLIGLRESEKVKIGNSDKREKDIQAWA